jgi:hypothetical protein
MENLKERNGRPIPKQGTPESSNWRKGGIEMESGMILLTLSLLDLFWWLRK